MKLNVRQRFTLVGTVTVAVLLIATAVIVWRVLAPAEVVTPATTSYPSAVFPKPGAVGALVSAPLILDDRIRIYAKKREVWSDGPASYQYERSAYWSYRRWPAQITGVALVEGEQSMVVTAWSDGVLVGIETGVGTVVWRTTGDPLAKEYTGRRTGAGTVYQPPGFHESGSRIITVSEVFVRAFAPDTGLELWRVPGPAPAGCLGASFTTASQVFVLDKCANALWRIDTATGALLPSMPATAVEPVSCAVANSNCTAMRLAYGENPVTGWVLTQPDPVESKYLAYSGAALVSQTVISSGPKSVTAIDLATGQPRWKWDLPVPGPFQLLAADASRTLVLSPDGMLVSLNTADGRVLVRTSVMMDNEPELPYEVAVSYTSGAYVVLERKLAGATVAASDETYYYTNRPVLLAYANLPD